MMNKLRRYFISGLVVFLPIALTIYLLVLAIRFFESVFGSALQPIFKDNFGFYFHGLGIAFGVSLILLIGFFVTNFIGNRIYEFFEKIFIRLPFIKQVYPAIKQMALFLFSHGQSAQFKQVVLIEYPRKGIYSFGFLTNESSLRIREKTQKDLCNVFTPSAPGPLTGFVVMISKKDIIFVDISVEEAFKFILSGGVVNPQ